MEKYAEELVNGGAKRDLEVLRKFQALLDKGNPTALIYYSKVWLGWSDTKAGAVQNKNRLNPPEASEVDAPTEVPPGQWFEDKILPFQPKPRR